MDINTNFRNGYKTRADASTRMSYDQISDVALSIEYVNQYVQSLSLIHIYFSKDIQTLLYLPIKPHHILASKFSVMLAFEYLFSLLVILPMYVAYVQELGASIGFVVIGACLLYTSGDRLYQSLCKSGV